MIKRIYILPTWHGVAFLGLILVMILVAAASGNNLVYTLSFILFGVFVLSMISTHANLKGLDIELLKEQEAFANETGFLRFLLTNMKSKSRYLIQAKAGRVGTGQEVTAGEVGPAARLHLNVPVRFLKRGAYDGLILQLATVYPLGLFRAWVNFRLEQPFYVYPERKGRTAWPHVSEGADQDGGQEDFKEHARYRAGESQHNIDWKAYARHGKLLSKRYQEAIPFHFVLDWQTLAHLPREEALSQLSLWISVLQNTPNSFELRLPDTKIDAGSGVVHARTCLRSLARSKEDA